MQKTIGFSYNKHGEETAITLACAWMHKMQEWYEVWRAHGCSRTFKFETPQLAVAMPPEWHELDRAAMAPETRQRYDQIDSMKPR